MSADALTSSGNVGDARCDSRVHHGSRSAVKPRKSMGPYDTKSADTLLSKRSVRDMLWNSCSQNENGTADAPMGVTAYIRKD